MTAAVLTFLWCDGNSGDCDAEFGPGPHARRLRAEAKQAGWTRKMGNQRTYDFCPTHRDTPVPRPGRRNPLP